MGGIICREEEEEEKNRFLEARKKGNMMFLQNCCVALRELVVCVCVWVHMMSAFLLVSSRSDHTRAHASQFVSRGNARARKKRMRTRFGGSVRLEWLNCISFFLFWKWLTLMKHFFFSCRLNLLYFFEHVFFFCKPYVNRFYISVWFINASYICFVLFCFCFNKIDLVWQKAFFVFNI